MPTCQPRSAATTSNSTHSARGCPAIHAAFAITAIASTLPATIAIRLRLPNIRRCTVLSKPNCINHRSLSIAPNAHQQANACAMHSDRKDSSPTRSQSSPTMCTFSSAALLTTLHSARPWAMQSASRHISCEMKFQAHSGNARSASTPCVMNRIERTSCDTSWRMRCKGHGSGAAANLTIECIPRFAKPHRGRGVQNDQTPAMSES